jgi:hypothetical protein
MNKDTLTVETDEEGTTTYRNAEDELHNPDGPAIACANGGKSYWINDQLHNANGPALVYANGYKAYWIHGKKLNKVEFKEWQAKQQ